MQRDRSNVIDSPLIGWNEPWSATLVLGLAKCFSTAGGEECAGDERAVAYFDARFRESRKNPPTRANRKGAASCPLVKANGATTSKNIVAWFCNVITTT